LGSCAGFDFDQHRELDIVLVFTQIERWRRWDSGISGH
jgi:hypothetical protein